MAEETTEKGTAKEKRRNGVILKKKTLLFTIRWAKWKQNVKVVEKQEIVWNGLVNIFVMPVITIDNAEMEYGKYNQYHEM